MYKLIAMAVVLLAVASCTAGIKGDGDFDLQGYASSAITSSDK